MAESMKDPRYLEGIVDRTVFIQGFPRKVDLDLKISALILTLEKLRRIRRPKQEPMEYEEFEQCELFFDTDKIVLTAPGQFSSMGSGTPPIRLQAPLLLFLLLRHREQYQVLEIIECFIKWIWPELAALDFKKMKTGVTRCFTNTRFAANVLRNYGLLKFTRNEAFKTWELSLTGLLVAARVLERRRASKTPTRLPVLKKEGNLDLSAEIRDACKEISSFDALVYLLKSVCRPDAKVFKTFEKPLKKAFDLLNEYWNILNDPTKSPRDRRTASLEKIKQLEQEGIDDRFYEEFSRCIQINDALARIFDSP